MQLYVFDSNGVLLYGPDARQSFDDALVARILAAHPGGRAWVHAGEPIAGPPLPVVDQAGELIGVAPDPAWTPPAPGPEPIAQLREKVDGLAVAVARQEQAVAANLLASPHDRRWLAQKERAKLFGVAWIKANPLCDQAGLEAALNADLALAFPDQPLVVAAGVILSYAAEAHARGYIPEPGFASLRELIVASSDAELKAMLAAL